jgi:hypothetical protein
MGTQWYISREGKIYGPIPVEELKRLADCGGLLPADLVWAEGLPQWEAACNINGLFAASDKIPPAPPPPPIAVDVPSPPPLSGRRDGSVPRRRSSSNKGKLVTGIILLLILAACGAWFLGPFGSKTSWVSKAEFRRRVLALDTRQKRFPPPLLVKEVDLISACGQPARTQTFSDLTFWYWDCKDGVMQVVIWAYQSRTLEMQLGKGVLYVKEINDY